MAAHPAPAGALGVSLKLWVVLARAYEAVARQSAADVARHGLTIPEFGILDLLYHKGPVFLGEVQKRVLVSSGGTTFLIDRLAAKGLVERRSCDTDRRARYAALTPAGERLIARIFPEHAEHMAKVLGGLSGKEQQQATALLRALGLHAAALDAPAESASAVRPAPRRRRTRTIAR